MENMCYGLFNFSDIPVLSFPTKRTKFRIARKPLTKAEKKSKRKMAQASKIKNRR